MNYGVAMYDHAPLVMQFRYRFAVPEQGPGSLRWHSSKLAAALGDIQHRSEFVQQLECWAQSNTSTLSLAGSGDVSGAWSVLN
eukprot:10225672-Alexandrium_andersonii.AAC.1